MSKFNTKKFGEKIKEVEEQMGGTIDHYVENKTKGELITYITEQLKISLLDSLVNQDLTKLLAIIDYTTHSTEISGEELPIIKENNGSVSLYEYANTLGHSDLASELVGYCKALHYIHSE